MWAATVEVLVNVEDSTISIHAARVGSDCPRCGAVMDKEAFQSTLPVWAATD